MRRNNTSGPRLFDRGGGSSGGSVAGGSVLSNDAFASAILNSDDHSDDGGENLRNEVMESIMSHEAAVGVGEGRRESGGGAQQAINMLGPHDNMLHPLQQSNPRSHEYNHAIGANEFGDNYSFRPESTVSSAPEVNAGQPNVNAHHHHHQQQHRQFPNNNSANLRINASPGLRNENNQYINQRYDQRRRQSNDTNATGSSAATGATRRSSILSSSLTSIKVQISEFDRLLFQRKDGSDRSLNSGNSNYEVPLPQMPHESKDALKVRIGIGLTCFIVAIFISVFLGRGQFGTASASYMYRNFILKDNVYHHHHTINDETVKNGSHLFEKVQTLERSFKKNVLGDPAQHIPIISIDDHGDIIVKVDHEMVMDHYIEFMWIKHVDSNQVVLARKFDPSEQGFDEAVLKAKVPKNVRLQPFLFCSRHELWVGEKFNIP